MEKKISITRRLNHKIIRRFREKKLKNKIKLRSKKKF